MNFLYKWREKKGLKTMEDFLNSKLLLNAILLKILVKENKKIT